MFFFNLGRYICSVLNTYMALRSVINEQQRRATYLKTLGITGIKMLPLCLHAYVISSFRLEKFLNVDFFYA